MVFTPTFFWIWYASGYLGCIFAYIGLTLYGKRREQQYRYRSQKPVVWCPTPSIICWSFMLAIGGFLTLILGIGFLVPEIDQKLKNTEFGRWFRTPICQFRKKGKT